ncbi:MAG: CSLREA domain-containing protein [Chloracidobacterium sp.]|nr:CSLREA domain-containing protein [Chloracidobacterium sp.]
MFKNPSTCRVSRTVFFQVFAAIVFAIASFSINAAAATFTVNTTADTQDAAPGNGVCGDAGGQCSLRAAITEANALAGADTITLPGGTYTTTLVSANENANAGGDLDITSPLTINGAGSATTIVQANAATQTANERVFHILAGGTLVTISDVTIQNGVFRFIGASPNPQGGGGIRVEGAAANLTIGNSTITGNLSENRGGGITANKSNLTLTNCIFNNNRAGSSVAGSAGSGGAIAIDSEDNIASAGQTATITNTIINSNRAESSVSNTFGGGIAIRAIGANVTLTGSTVSNNLSTALGGFSGYAAGINNQQATLNLNNTSVSFNTSSRYQAGVRNLASTAAVSTLNITNSTINNNTSTAADAFGGGVSNIVGSTFNATTNIDRSTISGNNLTGATSIGGGVINTGSTGGAALLNITNSTISGNSAHDAAGIFSDGSAAACSIDFSTIALNTAVAEGGGIYQDATIGGSTTIKNSIFANNVAASNIDVSELVTSANYNHIKNAPITFIPAANDVLGSDPALGVLANNGGPTQTHLPDGASLALNTIPNGTNGCGTPTSLDQRGLARPFGAGCDKGSVEVQPAGPTPTATNTSTPGPTSTNTNTPTPTATFTSTPTNTPTGTATSTSTPTNTPTGTPTSTPTSTATSTSTPTATPTGSGTPSISGTITYGNAVGSPNPRFVSGVLLSAVGSVNVSATSDFPNGNYVLTGFGSGSYTVTPSKADGQNGITSFDAARVAQHVAGVSILTGNQFLVADVSGNGQLSSFDAAQLARYVIGAPPFGSTGTWIFVPVNRSYASVNGNAAGEDFIALLMGEVSGNWTNSGARPEPQR